MTKIRRISDVDRGDRKTCGGKAANLGELYDDFEVPQGFILTTEVFKEELSDSMGQIEQILGVAGDKSFDEIRELSRELKTLVPESLDERTVFDIDDEAGKLEGTKFSVRSSAPFEDSEKSSFAGQFETFLNVDAEEIGERVIDCWKALFSPRVMSYIDDPGELSQGMAIIVQEMVEADVAGVIFTESPSDPDRLLLEMDSGLGDKVVSGEVTPDSYSVGRKSLEIEEISAEKCVIQHEKIKELAETALAVEEKLGSPQDIEWCIADDKIYILQSRPITS